MTSKKTVFGVVISKLAGLLVFLILLGIVNMISSTNENVNLVVQFLNNNLWLVVLFSILLFLGELFSIFIFPLNLVYPVFNAFGSIYVVAFIFNIFSLLSVFVNAPMYLPFSILSVLVYLLVFVIVLFVGYARIILSFAPEKKEPREKKPKKKKHRKKTDWRKKWDEFVEALNEFFIRVREILTEDKKKR